MKSAYSRIEARGALIAKILFGSWRYSPPEIHLSCEMLAEAAPFLLRTGGGALAWWRVRQSELGDCDAAAQLRQSYYRHTLQAGLYPVLIRQVSEVLASLDVDYLIGKGWAAARLYPEPGLRPYGDVDVYVRPQHYSKAVAAFKNLDLSDEAVALTASDVPYWPVDVHNGCKELEDRSFDDLLNQAVTVAVDEATRVKLLSPADHLRLLCLHLLRHGASRPLWLCDLAVALETHANELDWDRLLGGDRKRSHWVTCSLALAHKLIGARIEDTPVEATPSGPPLWVVSTVLREWGSRKIPHGLRAPMRVYIRRPFGLLNALRMRWPNPIEATVTINGRFSDWPRLPFQIAGSVARTFQFFTSASPGRGIEG